MTLQAILGPRVGGRGRERPESPGWSRPRWPAALCLSALVLSACAASQTDAAVHPQGAGFRLGLWHGFILPVAWIFSLFYENVALYAVPNNGGWYDFGYFLGIVVFGVGGTKAAEKRR